jgi:membrane dipeptidase
LTETLEERAARIHEQAIVVDAHSDALMPVMAGQSSLSGNPPGPVDFPKLKQGGVDAQCIAIYIEGEYKPDHGLKRAMQYLDLFYREVEAPGSGGVACRTTKQIKEASATGKTAAVLTIEGGEAIDGDLGVLRVFKRLGVVAMGLTWNQRNALADGIGEARAKGGLTTAGVDAVREMNRIGMVVDVSHMTEQGFWDVIDTSTKPIIASHANCRALCDHLRNLRDEQIKAFARNGGVIGATFVSQFIHATQPDLDHYLDHIDHMMDLVGPDHIGIGADLGSRYRDWDLKAPEDTRRVTLGLLKRGYSEADSEKILGGNFLRVFLEVLGE